MKKQILVSLFLLTFVSLVMVGCSDSTTNPVDTVKQGAYVVSYPVGAAIWIDNVNTGKVTPALIDTLKVGSHDITLKLTNYDNKAVALSTTSGKIDTVTANLSGADYAAYGPVRIWVISDTSTQHPSGLCLNNGLPYTIKAANANYVDFFLKDGQTSPDTTQVWQATLTGSLTRNASFFGTSETSLVSGGNVQNHSLGSWSTTLGLSTNKSFIVYDNDNHYSKVLVKATGIDATSKKQWVEFVWIYNKVNESYSF